MHAPLKPSVPLTAVYDKIRSVSPFMDTDRSLYEDIEIVSELILSGEILKIAQDAGANVE